MCNFVNLHTHSSFSSLDGLAEIDELVARTKSLGQPAIAITDHGNTGGWIKFDKEAKKHGVKPIFGQEFYFSDNLQYRPDKKQKEVDDETGFNPNARCHFILLARTDEGYRNLLKMTTLAGEGVNFYYKPRINNEAIKNFGKGVIGTTSCIGGKIPRLLYAWRNTKKDQYFDEAIMLAKLYKKYLDRFYIELQPNEMPEQALANRLLLKFHKETGLPLIAANDAHYCTPKDHTLHELLLAMQTSFGVKTVLWDDPNRFKFTTKEVYLKSRKDMIDSFRRWHPKVNNKYIKQALDNTLEVAEMCNANPVYGDKIMPMPFLPKRIEKKFDIADYKDIDDYYFDVLLRLSKNGLKKIGLHMKKEYVDRLKFELNHIRKLKFSKYLLVVWELIDWSRNNGIMVGPGRGSSAGSLVCYCLGITAIDPIRWGLLFYRFIDPNRTDNPDIDIDFEDEKRKQVVDHLIEVYGYDNVARIGNVILFKSKLALKDVARIFGVPHWETNDITPLILQRSDADERAKCELKDSFAEFQKLKEYQRKYPVVVKNAIRMEGRVKSYGIHACGTVVTPKPIWHYTSTRFDKKAGRVTILPGDDIAELGLLKLDILGLNTLTILRATQELIKARKGKNIDLMRLRLDNDNVLANFAFGNTAGVFQFSGRGMTGLCQALRVDKFDDLIAANALYRPGPLNSGQTEAYPDIKAGKIKRKPIHPYVDKHIVNDTYGQILYQEQIMSIVREIGGFSWKEVTDFRKLISKSQGAEVIKQKYLKNFVNGCIRGGLDGQYKRMKSADAIKLFKNMMAFGKYSFNKSHSAVYSLIAYQSMWLKLNYPLEFYAASLNKGHEDHAREIVDDAKRQRINIMFPDVNISKARWSIYKDSLIAGLITIKGIGEKACNEIVENQPFTDLFDFCRKVNRRIVNKKVINVLIKAGAFEDLHKNTGYLLENYEKLIQLKSTEKETYELKELSGKSSLTGEELTEIRAKVITLNIGQKHQINYFEKFIDNKLGGHVKVSKIRSLNELPESNNPFATKNVIVAGIARKIELRRLNIEATYAEANEDDFRYGLIDFEDDTDYITVTFRADEYRENEKKIWEWGQDSMWIVMGQLSISKKKIFATHVANMKELRTKVRNDDDNFTNFERYLISHPLTSIRKSLTRKGIYPIKVVKMRGKSIICGVIRSVKLTKTRKTKKDMVIFNIEDETGNIDVFGFGQGIKKFAKVLKKCYTEVKPVALGVETLRKGKRTSFYLSGTGYKTYIVD